MKPCSFLFLQGACSPFFHFLAERLVQNGHRVSRVNFTGGDLVYWNGHPSWSFRDRLEALPDFFDDKFRSCAATDLLLFGDRRPVHRPAIELARQRGIRTHVFEEGYFRPYWVTLEREGVNAHSRLPRDPDWYWRVGKDLPQYSDGEPFGSPFRLRVVHDVLYHLGSAINPLVFPRYRTHAPYSAPIEYAGYIKRFAMLPFHGRRDEKTVKDLIDNAVPFFLLPLQLSSDAQIRDHSPFDDMKDVMEFVLASFSRYAPGDTRLLIKNHPLDPGLADYSGMIRRMERHFDLSGRIHYVETGDLIAMLQHALGVVTVNSTVGTLALQRRCPTITLSNPIYNLPGLTSQGTLDEFWQDPVQPNFELFCRFRNTVIHTTQVNGGFYSIESINLAVRNSLSLLESDRSPLDELL